MASLSLYIIVFVCATSYTNGDAISSLGTCWQIKHRSRDYYCGKPLRTGVTRQRCCSGKLKRSWNAFLPREVMFSNSTQERRAASKEWVLKYRNSVINSPSQMCLPCARTCRNVKCGENEKCVMKRGLPKCVCSPECHLQHKAPVCGTDGRTYRSECHLLKRSCRKRKKVKISHSGKCQTCNGVKCGRNKACVLDALLNAKCVRCPTSCERNSSRRPFCGSDDVTYTSKCLAKLASCQNGRIINRAYRGPCQERASCASVRCWRHEDCLTEVSSGNPRCWKCGDYHKCPQTHRHVCASDGNTYQSWCEFRLEACRSGKAFDAVPLHECPKKRKKSSEKYIECVKSPSLSEEVNNLLKGTKEAESSETDPSHKQRTTAEGSLSPHDSSERKERRRERKRRRKKECRKAMRDTSDSE